MIKEAIETLTKLARESAEPKVIDLGDPREKRYAAGGSVAVVELPPKPRAHKPGTLDDVITLAERFATSGTPAVWYDTAAVVLVIDDADHRLETATLGLDTSDVFAVLERLRARPGEAWLEQKEFVRLLRIDLAGTLPPATLLNPVRKVKFENGVKVSSEVQSRRESLGREITSKVEAETELPEEVTLSAPVYKTAGERDAYPVRCSVEVDPMQGRFRLLPLPDELERVRDLAVSSIGERLLERLPESVPAYRGRP